MSESSAEIHLRNPMNPPRVIIIALSAASIAAAGCGPNTDTWLDQITIQPNTNQLLVYGSFDPPPSTGAIGRYLPSGAT